jgi:hypothetical protein
MKPPAMSLKNQRRIREFPTPMAKTGRRTRTHNTEQQVSEWLLGDFQPAGSRGAMLLERVSGVSRLSLRTMLKFADIFSALSQISFGRDYKRRRDLIVKWIDDHYAELEPFATVIRADITGI